MKQQSELRRAKEAEEHLKFQKAAVGTALSRSQHEEVNDNAWNSEFIGDLFGFYMSSELR